jgi:hypothetical protein
MGEAFIMFDLFPQGLCLDFTACAIIRGDALSGGLPGGTGSWEMSKV